MSKQPESSSTRPHTYPLLKAKLLGVEFERDPETGAVTWWLLDEKHILSTSRFKAARHALKKLGRERWLPRYVAVRLVAHDVTANLFDWGVYSVDWPKATLKQLDVATNSTYSEAVTMARKHAGRLQLPVYNEFSGEQL